MLTTKLIIIAAIAVALIVLFLYVVISISNRLNLLMVKVEEGRSDIDVALEKRFDLINEQVAVVKKYLQHEYDTMVDVTRSRLGNATLKEAEQERQNELAGQEEEQKLVKQLLDSCADNYEKVQVIHKLKNEQLKEETMLAEERLNSLKEFEQTLNGIGKHMKVLTEQYPNLVSAASVQQLQMNIQETEEFLSAARRLYNSNVSLYNQTIIAIPYSIIANLRHMQKAPFYEGSEEKKNVKVEF